MKNLCPIAYWKKHCPNAFAFPTLTYLQFDKLIQKVCYEIAQIPQPTICFAPQKNPIDIALFFAAWRLGKAVYPVNPRLPIRSIQERIEKTKSKWVETKKLSLAKSLEIEEINPHLLATLLETSSANKIVCHPLHSHLLSAQNVCKALYITHDTIYSLNLPLFHVSGIATFLRTFLAGAQLTFPENEKQATHISLVPTQLFRMLQNDYNLPNIKCLLMGGAPLSEKLYKEALRKNLPLYLSYGMTETASMALLNINPSLKQMTRCVNETQPDQSEAIRVSGGNSNTIGSRARIDMAKSQVADCHLFGARVNNTQILPHIEFTLADDGEILLRGMSLFSHYWEGEIRKKEDWFATGDLGTIHADGEIEIVGRKDRQFISGGENIQPEEIEKALLQFDSIIEARITPEPDPEFGMRPKAEIYSKIPLTADSIKEKLKEIFPTYKIPEKIHVQTHPLESKLTRLTQSDVTRKPTKLTQN